MGGRGRERERGKVGMVNGREKEVEEEAKADSGTWRAGTPCGLF